MSEVAELKARIAAALDRIERGLQTPSAAPAPAPAVAAEPDAVAKLRAELAAAQANLDGMSHKLRVNRRNHEKDAKTWQRRLAELSRQADAAAKEMARLKALVQDLTETTRALREAAAAGLADPQALNAAMERELEALRAARAAEIAEMEAIMGELLPVLEEEEEAAPAKEEAEDA